MSGQLNGSQYAYNTGLSLGHPCTIAGWFYPTVDPSPQMFACGLSSSAIANLFCLSNFVGSAFSSQNWAQDNSPITGGIAKSSSSYSLNTWIHVACRFQDFLRQVVINGVQQGTDSTTVVIASPSLNTFILGGNYNAGSPSSLFTGLLSRVAVLSAFESDANIAAMMAANNPATIDPSNVVAWYLPGGASNWNDQSGNGLNLTTSGSPGFNASEPPVSPTGGTAYLRPLTGGMQELTGGING